MSLKAFTEKYLFGYLGITQYWWDADPRGDYGALSLTPRDMAKFGYLYLMGGKWGDRQVMPEEWVKESTRVQVDPGDGLKYGYLWWLENRMDKVHDKQFSVFSAIGYRGQFITVIPELDSVAVITSYHSSWYSKGNDTYQLITDYVIPSVVYESKQM
jgi:CubicO group peptidase (beta-lactamase class C family)